MIPLPARWLLKNTAKYRRTLPFGRNTVKTCHAGPVQKDISAPTTTPAQPHRIRRRPARKPILPSPHPPLNRQKCSHLRPFPSLKLNKPPQEIPSFHSLRRNSIAHEAGAGRFTQEPRFGVKGLDFPEFGAFLADFWPILAQKRPNHGQKNSLRLPQIPSDSLPSDPRLCAANRGKPPKNRRPSPIFPVPWLSANPPNENHERNPLFVNLLHHTQSLPDLGATPEKTGSIRSTFPRYSGKLRIFRRDPSPLHRPKIAARSDHHDRASKPRELLALPFPPSDAQSLGEGWLGQNQSASPSANPWASNWPQPIPILPLQSPPNPSPQFNAALSFGRIKGSSPDAKGKRSTKIRSSSPQLVEKCIGFVFVLYPFFAAKCRFCPPDAATGKPLQLNRKFLNFRRKEKCEVRDSNPEPTA